jgi:hypothetical protein
MKNLHSLPLRTICLRDIASIAREEFRGLSRYTSSRFRPAGNGGQQFWISSVIQIELKGKCGEVRRQLTCNCLTETRDWKKIRCGWGPVSVLTKASYRAMFCVTVLSWHRLSPHCTAAVVCKLSPDAHTRNSYTDLDFDMSAYLCTSIHHQPGVWRK